MSTLRPIVSEFLAPLLPTFDHKESRLKQRTKRWYDFQKTHGEHSRSFMHCLASKFPELTRTELQICSMIRFDKRTKEIAEILNISAHTIENHRSSIRTKLKLHSKQRLQTALLEQ